MRISTFYRLISSMLIIIVVFETCVITKAWAKEATYRLSNGSTVRIEYHGGNAHVHEVTKNGEKRSEDLVTGEKHHSKEKTLTKKTKEMLKDGKGLKSTSDKAAHKKTKEYLNECAKYKKARDNSNKQKSSNSFLRKNLKAIENASKTGRTYVIIAGVTFLVSILHRAVVKKGIACKNNIDDKTYQTTMRNTKKKTRGNYAYI